MNYELVMTDECFDDDENILDCEWFKTEEKRTDAINKAYAEQEQFTPEQ